MADGNPALDSRTGDEVTQAEAWAETPQQTDGPEVGGDAVSVASKRPKKKAKPAVVEASHLDSRGGGELPGEEAFRPVPQNVDGPDPVMDKVEPRG